MPKPLMASIAAHPGAIKSEHRDQPTFPDPVYKTVLSCRETDLTRGTITTKVSRETTDES